MSVQKKPSGLTLRVLGGIVSGSVLYALAIHFFIFPCNINLGGTSGISVIISRFVPTSAGMILSVINYLLLIAAWLILGRNLAIRTFLGSLATTAAVTLLDRLLPLNAPVVAGTVLSAVIGSAIIAVAGALLFYLDSSSGGTDIIALIVKKFSHFRIGRALMITDILIVLGGIAVTRDIPVAVASVLGFLIKTRGIDAVIHFLNLTNKSGGKTS